jgi:ankyrin repeat protein
VTAGNFQHDGGDTPLYAACQHGHTEVAAMLCSKGAAINQAADTQVTQGMRRVRGPLRR